MDEDTSRRCRNCQFWTRTLGAQWDEYWHNHLGEGWGYCRVTIEGSASGGQNPDVANPLEGRTLAYVQDAEGWLGVLATSADFGCVQFRRP